MIAYMRERYALSGVSCVDAVEVRHQVLARPEIVQPLVSVVVANYSGAAWESCFHKLGYLFHVLPKKGRAIWVT